MHGLRSRFAGVAGLVAACGAWGLAAPAVGARTSDAEVLRFAAQMAEQGSWHEARYRWEQLAARDPNNPIVLNNLGVAAEATGDLRGALDYYARALAAGAGDPRVADNRALAQRLREELEPREGDDGASAEPPAPPDPGPAPGAESKLGKPVQVEIGVPVPPRIDIADRKTVLVASFLHEDNAYLDVNRELVRLLRGEFRKQSPLEVLDIVPPPAVPEQPPADLVRNAEFWKHLSREYGGDLIVSGVVSYNRRDVSGFREVDTIDARTGQKIRQTRFVEQEEFSYDVDMFFFDGPTGGLLHRDRIRRTVTFRGLMNDPLHAFYEIGESIANDVLSAVVTRVRSERRTIFRR